MCEHPDFSNYLITIAAAPELTLPQRQTAAVLLKSLLERHNEIVTGPYFKYMKTRLVSLLEGATPELANIISNSIVTVISSNDFHIWPEILKLLNALIRTGKRESVENGVLCLEKLCEDVKVINQKDIESIIPSLVELIKSKSFSDKARGAAVNSLNLIYNSMGSTGFKNYLALIVPMMLEWMKDPNAGQKANKLLNKNLCALSITLHEHTREEIGSIASVMFDYHIRMLGSEEHEVSYAACEFWKRYLHIKWNGDYEDQKWELLEGYLPKLLPQLLRVMKYSNNDLAEMIKDTELDIKYTETEDLAAMEECTEGFSFILLSRRIWRFIIKTNCSLYIR